MPLVFGGGGGRGSSADVAAAAAAAADGISVIDGDNPRHSDIESESPSILK